VDDAAGTVAIRDLGRREKLYADEKGLTVRARGYGTRRFAWRKVSGFADGGTWKQGEYVWQLDIVLRKGQREPVPCTAGSFTPELAATLREVAARHGVSADVEGVVPPAPPPDEAGFYHDPAGADGMRYWNGLQWSPLLPADIPRPRSVAVNKSTASWSALPTVEEPWTWAAKQARAAAANAVCIGVFAAAMLGWPLLTLAGLIPAPGGEPMTPDEWLPISGFAVLYGFVARGQWRKRRFWRSLDEAANRAPAVREGYP
jgi:hypothetical protein